MNNNAINGLLKEAILLEVRVFSVIYWVNYIFSQTLFLMSSICIIAMGCLFIYIILF